MMLKRFWFNFASTALHNGLGLGCGVTAYSYDDAISILRTTVFSGGPLPEIGVVIEDVDVTTLDQNHVIPNMETPVWRGVWFPKGFALSR